MIQSSIAKRYARALLAVAEEEGDTEGPLGELERVQKALSAHPKVKAALTSPTVGKEARRAVVESLARSLELSSPVGNLLRLLGDRARFPHFDGIVRAYQAMADEKMGRVRGTLTASHPVSSEALHALERKLSQITTRSVTLEARTDPSLLGGVVAQVGSMLYDGSVRTQLERMRRELKD